MDLSDPEKALFHDAETGELTMELPRAGFIASGVDYDQLGTYMKRFTQIAAHLDDLVTGDDQLGNARAIFEWLWKSKPHRYERGGNFKLTRVIDAQLGESDSVGNCLGLTTLYNSIAQALHIPMAAAYIDDFQGYPHVFSILYSGTEPIPIENIYANGFDFDVHRQNTRFVAWKNLHLIADIYNSRANEEDNEDHRLKRDLLLSYTLADEKR
jgi:hypothetical protein